MTLSAPDDDLQRQLETALDIAECDRVKYHLREAMQLRISDADLECKIAEQSERCQSD